VQVEGGKQLAAQLAGRQRAQYISYYKTYRLISQQIIQSPTYTRIHQHIYKEGFKLWAQTWLVIW
jgi:hypothetical protein